MKSQSRLAPILTALVVMLGGGYLVGISVSQSPVTTVAPTLVAGAVSSSASTPTVITVDCSRRNVTSGETLTDVSTVTIKGLVDSTSGGTMTAFVGNVKREFQGSVAAQGHEFENMTLREGTNHIHVEWKEVDTQNEDGSPATYKTIIASEVHTITLDTIGPQLQSASLVDMPTAGSTLVVRFADADANQLSSAAGATANWVIQQEKQPGAFEGSVSAILEPSGDGRTAHFYLGKLTTGAYRFIAFGKKDESATPSVTEEMVFTDTAGNPAGKQTEDGDGRDIVYTFSSMPERERGEHVEFPPFAPPQPTPAPPEGFNPADYVDTRVARLYYYRDAHRVAEILNRNVKSYNRAAVTQAEQRAQAARVTAEEKADARRKAEREAVQAAEQTRNAETKLNDARQVLREATDVQFEKEDAIAQSNTIASRYGLAGASDEAKLLAYKQAKTDGDQRKEADLAQMLELDEAASRADANLKRLGGDRGVQQIQEYVGQVERAVADLRQAEITAQEESNTAQAIEEQFRQEVAAAHEDPDTYVPGDVTSVDPVTQVSISVIGEGLIHLRGPMRGINKIRTMINQIDSPVGQIKIGIETVQVNGEDGDAMEEVVGRIQGEIDLGRFLTAQSLNLLRKAIQIEAGLVAEYAQTGGNYQVDRDRKYLYTFYGRDFIDELYAIDSEFLRTENAILSLHSMDTISLNRALFTLALAKNDIRERIMCRFLALVKTELPDAEFDFRRSSELRPHQTQKRFPPWNTAHLPLWNKPHIETVLREAVDRNACQRYHFRNIRGFFDVGFGTADVMNPMQREFVRLAQIYKARMIAEMELKQRVMERALIEDPASDESERTAVFAEAHKKALEQLRDAWLARVTSATDLDDKWVKIGPWIPELETAHKEHYRPDLYHRRRQPSPYHPGGYTYGGQSDPNQQPGPETRPINDPSGRNFERTDRRPPEMQQPPYDLYRHSPVPPQRIEAGPDLHGVRTAPLPPTVGQTWGSPGESTSVITR